MTAALERLRHIEEPWSEEDLAEVLDAAARDCGFSHVASFSLPSTDDEGLATRLIHSNWSAEFARGYEHFGLHRFKIVLGTLRTDPMPFVWDIETLYGADDPDPSPAAQFLAEEGYRAGVLLPVHAMTSFNGAVSFAGAGPDLSQSLIRDLHLFAFGYFSMLAAARFEENRRNNPLSVRERDCLKFAMLGKTSNEIGTILSLSEYTVSQYLTSAQRKMNASNRTHAVAMAAQLGYLS
ncbi:helix-turn-helix transcriptional regulator [Jiella marina]|uniref:helix-turn-helix transcriptional regulator n=1 Tax=Jiella sp. LLJ827 TaxID=2917712 RepID=UPI002101A576|nr:LuxR family transcriptional regulator [Jiella sp. LLJ827]MCQ0988488.1 LuxR family transcriptional regulator [Jiella sp. LLJ827]